MLGVIGIILSLCALIYLAYRGYSVIILAPALALVAVAISGELPLLATYTEVFMKHFAAYAKSFFPLFLLGAVFGKVIEDSGSAKSIALAISRVLGRKRAIGAVVLACALLTYGGVSLFVVAFAVFPVAAALFYEADIPKRLIPGTIALGSFTFTMAALPGSPQIQNTIPMPYFGTTTYAAPVIGIIAGVVIFVLGITWLNRRANQAHKKKEGFGKAEFEIRKEYKKGELPRALVALMPIFVVLVVNFYLTKIYFPHQDTSYLRRPVFETTADKVVGTWAIIASLSFGIVLTMLINWKRMKTPVTSINEGAQGSLLAIVNTCSEVGYGNVIASLAAFALVKTWILNVSSNPLVSESIAVSTLAGITGSASGGLSIALATLGSTYAKLGTAAGYSPEVLHRIATISSGGMDSLPHNGAVITLLSICGLTHRESYLDIGVVTVIIPLVALVVAITLATLGVS